MIWLISFEFVTTTIVIANRYEVVMKQSQNRQIASLTAFARNDSVKSLS